MGNANSIEPCSLRAQPAQLGSSGATDAVARMSKTIPLSQRGPTLRADADENIMLTPRSIAWRLPSFAFRGGRPFSPANLFVEKREEQQQHRQHGDRDHTDTVPGFF